MAERLLQIGLSAGLSLAMATGGGPSGCENKGNSSSGTGDTGQRTTTPAAPRATHSPFDFDKTRDISCNGVAWHDNGKTLTFSPEISGGDLPKDPWIEGDVQYSILHAGLSHRFDTRSSHDLSITVPDQGVTVVDMVVKWPAGNINEVRECRSWLETRRFNVPDVAYHGDQPPAIEPADTATYAGAMVVPLLTESLGPGWLTLAA